MTNLRSETALLKDLGLSEKAASVFGYLLAHPDTNATEITHALNTHKQPVYQALKELERRRLVHRYQQNRTSRYQLLNADQLIEDATHQQEVALEIGKRMQYAAQKTRPSGIIQLFEGIDGFRAFTEQILEESSAIDLFSANLRFQTIFPQQYAIWDARRAKKQIPFRVLVPSGLTQGQRDQEQCYELRRLRTNVFAGVLWILNTAIAYALWETQHTSQIVLIRNALLARQQRILFKKLWEQSV